MAYNVNCGRKNDIPEQPARRYIRFRAAGSICKEHVISSSFLDRYCPRAEIEPSSATHGADERGRGESGTNYRGQVVRKGSRSPTGSHMF